MKTILKGISVAILAGLVVTWISIYIVGVLAAIAYPPDFFAWAKHHGLLHATLQAIYFFEQLLGVGTCSAIVSYFLTKKFTSIWISVALTFFMTQIAMLYLYFPYTSEYQFSLQQYYLSSLPRLIVLLISIFIPAFIVYRSKKVKDYLIE